MKGTEEYDKRFRDAKDNRLITANRQRSQKTPSLDLLSNTIIELEAKMLIARYEALLKINE